VRPGRYAATDGSFGRSAGAAVGRGVILLVVAVVIGIVLLNATDGAPPGSQVVAAGTTTKTTKKPSGTTTTTVAPTTTVAVPAHAPKDVKVIVANGSTTNGAGKRATDLLRPPGYNVLSPTNTPQNAPDSSVYFSPGYDKDAAAIAAALQLAPASVKPVPSTPVVADAKGAQVIVVVGVADGPKFAAPATTTTARAATTTTARAATTTTAAKTATTTTAKAAVTTTTKKP